MAIKVVGQIDMDVVDSATLDMSPYALGDIFVNFPNQNGEALSPYSTINGIPSTEDACVYYADIDELTFTGTFGIHGFILRGVTATWCGENNADATFPEADLSSYGGGVEVTDVFEVSLAYWIHEHRNLVGDPPAYENYDSGDITPKDGLVLEYVDDVLGSNFSFVSGVSGMMSKRWGPSGIGPVIPATSYDHYPPAYGSNNYQNKRYIFLEFGGRHHAPFQLVGP